MHLSVDTNSWVKWQLLRAFKTRHQWRLQFRFRILNKMVVTNRGLTMVAQDKQTIPEGTLKDCRIHKATLSSCLVCASKTRYHPWSTTSRIYMRSLCQPGQLTAVDTVLPTTLRPLRK